MKEIAIGIDIGATNTVLGIVDREGNILAENDVRTKKFPCVNDFIEVLNKTIQETLTAPKEQVEPMGIGIGAPNANYYRGNIEHAPNLAWKGIIPLKEMMEKYFEFPIVITNDANAAAMGEMIYGGAKKMKNFIVYTLGTGLGSGIVINGEVLYGYSGFAGEIGHIIMVPGGRDCGCGRKGCLENYVSATGLCRTVLELLGERREKSELRKVKFEDLTSKMIAKAAESGDKIAQEAFDETARMLALSIVNAVAFSSPEAIFLFGGLAQAGNLIFNPTQKYIDEFIQIVFKDTVKLLPSQIKENNAAVLGASALIWNELARRKAI